MTPLQAVFSPGWVMDAPASTPVVLLLLHGFGSNEQDLTALAPALPPALPWASLRAPLTLPHGGRAWFPITTPGKPDPGPVAAATQAIWQWVDAHLAEQTRVVSLGFSQGGLMATQLLRTRPERVASTVVLSGFVQAAPQSGDELAFETRPAVFWGRGSDDRVITPAAIDRTSRWLQAHSTVAENVYPGLAHGISAEEMADVCTFLGEQLGSQDSR